MARNKEACAACHSAQLRERTTGPTMSVRRANERHRVAHHTPHKVAHIAARGHPSLHVGLALPHIRSKHHPDASVQSANCADSATYDAKLQADLCLMSHSMSHSMSHTHHLISTALVPRCCDNALGYVLAGVFNGYEEATTHRSMRSRGTSFFEMSCRRLHAAVSQS